MKPRPSWKIADGNASARRTDGVVAGFYFLGEEKPYGVKRPYQSPRQGMLMEFLRPVGSLTAKKFRTLTAAMEAADKAWPP